MLVVDAVLAWMAMVCVVCYGRDMEPVEAGSRRQLKATGFGSSSGVEGEGRTHKSNRKGRKGSTAPS